MSLLRFQVKLIPALVLVTLFLFMALQAPLLFRPYVTFGKRSIAGPRKINGGRLESDIGQEFVGFNFRRRSRSRSLRSIRLPPPPPAPMRNRQKNTFKAAFAAPPSTNHTH